MTSYGACKYVRRFQEKNARKMEGYEEYDVTCLKIVFPMDGSCPAADHLLHTCYIHSTLT